jgi:hypothetical protein
MPRATKQATIEAQAQEIEALKQELAQALQAFKSLLVTPEKQGQAQELDLYLSGLE